jgi:hypothetical protein
LSKCIKVLFKEDIILFLIRDGQKETDIIFRNSLFQLILRIGILISMKELTNRIPKTIRNQRLILNQIQIPCPLLNSVLTTIISVLLVLDLLEIGRTQ